MAARRRRRGRGEGALFSRKDRKRWIGRITVNGTPRAVSARTTTEARHKLDNLRRAADDGFAIPDAKMTVADLLELWDDNALPNRNLSPSRIASHQWAIRILTTELGSTTLRALTVDGVEAALARRTTPADDNQPRQTSRAGCDECPVAELDRQTPIDTVPSSRVGAATRPRRPQRRHPRRTPHHRPDQPSRQIAHRRRSHPQRIPTTPPTALPPPHQTHHQRRQHHRPDPRHSRLRTAASPTPHAAPKIDQTFTRPRVSDRRVPA